MSEIRDSQSTESPSSAAYVTVDLTEFRATAGVEVPPAYTAQLLQIGYCLMAGVLVTAAPIFTSIHLARAEQPPWLIVAIVVTQVVAVGMLSWMIRPRPTQR